MKRGALFTRRRRREAQLPAAGDADDLGGDIPSLQLPSRPEPSKHLVAALAISGYLPASWGRCISRICESAAGRHYGAL